MVPTAEATVGSYFMANGFQGGYFGMQVNSPTERRFIFSVWSPFKTHNPNEVPEDYKIELLGKGENTATKVFGGEGTGGHSRLVYPWETEKTYGFLVKGAPSEGFTDRTTYTAWVRAVDNPEEGWILMASWRRPKGANYLTGWYGFAENFVENNADLTR